MITVVLELAVRLAYLRLPSLAEGPRSIFAARAWDATSIIVVNVIRKRV
jgi:hypothetical protein